MTLESTRKITEHSVRSLAWVGSHLAAGTSAGTVHVWDWKAGTELGVWKGGRLPVVSLAMSDDSQKLAIGMRPGDWNEQIADPLLLWKFQNEKEPQVLHGHKLGVSRVRFIGDGKSLISCGDDWTVRIWNTPQQTSKL